MTAKKPTPKQAEFVRQYIIDFNGTQAAIRAGYSKHTARNIASELLAKPHIAAAIAEAIKKRSEATEITAAAVLAHYWDVATANPNDLVEYRRFCCRYCYGKDGRYQYTDRELAEAKAGWVREQLTAKDGDPAKAFDEAGGGGYDKRLGPNPECQDCRGDGTEEAFFKDTRSLSPAARRLYAGVKVTEKGVEVKMHEQLAALAKVGQHLGMFAERHLHAGDPANPTPIPLTGVFALSAEEKAKRLTRAKKVLSAGS